MTNATRQSSETKEKAAAVPGGVSIGFAEVMTSDLGQKAGVVRAISMSRAARYNLYNKQSPDAAIGFSETRHIFLQKCSSALRVQCEEIRTAGNIPCRYESDLNSAHSV